MAAIIKIAIVLLLFLTCHSCMLMGALIHAKRDKETISCWKEPGLKTRIQIRKDWSGPAYYHCRVKEKSVGDFRYKTIVKSPFPKEEFDSCLAIFAIPEHSIHVNACDKTTRKIKRVVVR